MSREFFSYRRRANSIILRYTMTVRTLDLTVPCKLTKDCSLPRGYFKRCRPSLVGRFAIPFQDHFHIVSVKSGMGGMPTCCLCRKKLRNAQSNTTISVIKPPSPEPWVQTTNIFRFRSTIPTPDIHYCFSKWPPKLHRHPPSVDEPCHRGKPRRRASGRQLCR